MSYLTDPFAVPEQPPAPPARRARDAARDDDPQPHDAPEAPAEPLPAQPAPRNRSQAPVRARTERRGDGHDDPDTRRGPVEPARPDTTAGTAGTIPLSRYW